MINKILGLLGIATKAGKTISGTDIVIENIKKKKVKLVIIALDSSDRTKEKMKNICLDFNIPIVEYGNIEQNSKAIGKENKAIIAVLDEKLAKSILDKISGGEEFGKN